MILKLIIIATPISHPRGNVLSHSFAPGINPPFHHYTNEAIVDGSVLITEQSFKPIAFFASKYSQNDTLKIINTATSLVITLRRKS